MLQVIEYVPPETKQLNRLSALKNPEFQAFLHAAGVYPFDPRNQDIACGPNAVKLFTRYRLLMLGAYLRRREQVLELNEECVLEDWFDMETGDELPVDTDTMTFAQWIQDEGGTIQCEAVALLILDAFSNLNGLQLEIYFRTSEEIDRWGHHHYHIVGIRHLGSNDSFLELVI